MRRIGVGVIGTGWIGEIRARVCAAHPLVAGLHLAEIDPDRAGSGSAGRDAPPA